MVDPLTTKERSVHMAKIRGKDTRPEMVVRRGLHGAGYRFRTHYPKLPGRPDIVFTARRKVVFVHGCFWHYHEGCKIAHLPKTRTAYWRDKLEGNRARDARNLERLREMGWDAFVVWECEVKEPGSVLKRLRTFLGPPQHNPRRSGEI